MEWSLSAEEREHLRELARRQAEYAALPVMDRRRRMWLDLNDGRPGARPPVVVETDTFDRDFLPPHVFRCRSETGRGIEAQLLRNVRNHELIDDDKVVPGFFATGSFVDVDRYGGVRVATERARDAQGVETAYRYIHPIKDLREDLRLLRPAVCTLDVERTLAWESLLADLFDGVLEVRNVGGPSPCAFLTGEVVALVGMESFFVAMYDAPDAVHRLMGYLRDNFLRVMRWAEENGLLRVNNGNDASFGSSYNFTTRLPAAGHRPPAARLCDMWGAANSQETVGISPGMFHDFCFPYYRDACEPLGLLYYGCCEPAHSFWDDIRRLPHLKKVSVSRWCDERFVGEALRGTGIVFSRKPDPKFLGVDETLDEEGWRAHVRETLEAARGVGVEFIVRDVYTVHGNLGKPRRAVELARDEIERHYRP